MYDGSVGGLFSPSGVFSARFKASHDAADVNIHVNKNGVVDSSSKATTLIP